MSARRRDRRLLGRVAAVFVLLGCGGAPAPTSNAGRPAVTPPPAPVSSASPLDPAIELALRAEAGAWTFVPLAQVECGARAIAIVWPAMDASGATPDDDIVGYAFERGPSGVPRMVEGNFAARWPELPQCQGAPRSLHRGSVGVPRVQVGEALLARLAAVQRAARSRDRLAFVSAVLSLAELFDDAALFGGLTDALTDLLRQDLQVVRYALTAEGLTLDVAHAPTAIEHVTVPLRSVPGPDDRVVLDVDR